jgi:ATP-dependent DNA helicase DinG
LTDLVIPKVPFGVERSLAHLRRQKTLPTAERDRALFQFKQGVGRLIRRPGLLHRKLWILDSRIHGVEKPWLYKPFQTLIAQYSNRMTLEPV